MRRFIVPVLLGLAACASQEARQTVGVGLAYPNKACAQTANQRVADAIVNGIPRADGRRIFNDTYAACSEEKTRILIGSLPPP